MTQNEITGKDIEEATNYLKKHQSKKPLTPEQTRMILDCLSEKSLKQIMSDEKLGKPMTKREIKSILDDMKAAQQARQGLIK